MDYNKYSGLVCGFQFLDSLKMQAIRDELETKFKCKICLVTKANALEAGSSWDKHISNVFFIYSANGLPVNLLVKKDLSKFLDKSGFYPICFYDQGDFYGFSEVIKIASIAGASSFSSVGIRPLLAIIKLMVKASTIGSLGLVRLLERASKGNSF